MKISKEYFDKKFAEVDEKFAAQTKELKQHTREQVEELAIMVKEGFDHTDKQIAELADQLDIRDQFSPFRGNSTSWKKP
jgi:hypothetical protein